MAALTISTAATVFSNANTGDNGAYYYETWKGTRKCKYH